MSLMEISKSIPQDLDYSEGNQILPKNDTQKSENIQKSGNSPKRYPKIRKQPQKGTQNNGTSPYPKQWHIPVSRHMQVPPPPPTPSLTFHL